MNMFKPTAAKTPDEYINMQEEPRKTEMKKIHEFIRQTVPDLKPYIISGMIGYGTYHYKSKSGREGEWPPIALSSRKNYISVYACATDGNAYLTEGYKDKLKADIGKSCIRFKRFEDIDFDVLSELLKKTEKLMSKDIAY